MRYMKYRLAISLIASYAMWITATAQNEPKNNAKPAANCLQAQDLVNTDLFGTWTLELQSDSNPPSITRLTLERNPEYAESLAGNYMQGTVRHEVFGDVDNGILDLEESNNGKDIIAIWKGRVISSGCNPAMTGTRRVISATATAQAEQNFVLRRAGW
jgi:hypothetical protein